LPNLPKTSPRRARGVSLPPLRTRSVFGVLVVLPLLFLPGVSPAQPSFEVATITTSQPIANRDLMIRAELNEPSGFDRVYFRYHPFGAAEYTTLEMDLHGATATARVPADDVLAPFIEYYLIFVRPDGSMETNPSGSAADPFSSPPGSTLQIQIRDQENTAGVIFLSPETAARLQPDDVIFAFSLLRTDTTIVRTSTQVRLDGIDVTDKVVASGDLFVFVPDNAGVILSGGRHVFTVHLFDQAGFMVDEASLEFEVTGAGLPAAPVETGIAVTGNVNGESRYEDVARTGTWYNRADVRLQGRMDDWAVVANAFVTSDERSDRQPQNRFFGGVQSSWLQAGYGDSYPVFPSLIMNGMRLRGFSGRALAGPQVFMAAVGEVNRALEGSLLKVIPINTLAAEQQADPTAAYAPIAGSADWGKFSYGTFQRNLLVLRTETLLGRTGGIGLTVLKGKDDDGSIAYGSRPQENLVVGLDFRGSFDSRRIEFSGQGAFSAYNADISSGTFSDTYIDSTFKGNASEVKTLKDILGPFITVNDNLRPLSVDQLSTLAYEFGLGLNYFENRFSAKYVFRGSDYLSFGQTYLRTDIQGVTLADRVGLSDDQILLSLGFEQLQDNTSNYKVATTVFQNITAALSFYPRTEGPSVTIGFGQYSSDNGLSVTGTDSLQAIDDVDNRVYLQSSYNFFYGARHTGSFNLSTSSRTDYSPRQLNVNSTTASMRLFSRFDIPLETNVDISFSFNSLPTAVAGAQQQSDYTTLSLSGLYRLFQNRLSLEGRVSPTFGDVQRTVYDTAVGYAIEKNLTIQMRFTYYANHGLLDDNIWRTTLRYDL